MAIVNFDSNNSNSDNRKYLFSRFFAANQKNAFSKLKKVCLGQNNVHIHKITYTHTKKAKKNKKHKKEEKKKKKRRRKKKRKKCGVKTFLLGHWHSQQ